MDINSVLGKVDQVLIELIPKAKTYLIHGFIFGLFTGGRYWFILFLSPYYSTQGLKGHRVTETHKDFVNGRPRLFHCNSDTIDSFSLK